ncbi:hypothetical protein E4U13_005362 [Claviceps humidiphila]|uniref:Uncharacterized protein n=1 Tax=Claviceps humidiphila TaxID=1294629 RepID=A0A9P7Q7E2_9HYPO|nr:hypothetical protein E4U13_005362 [Claviceps humidiphila]
MPNRRGSLNLRPASARRLPKRYESEEHHQDDSRQEILVYASHRSSARKQASALQTTKKRRAAAAAAAATNVGALSALSITTSPLRKEGMQQYCRVHHHRMVQGTASWSLSAPFLGAEADMSTTWTTTMTPLFSLGDLDWGSDDDDVPVVQEAALDQAGRSPIHGMSSSTTWRSTTATNRVS